MLNPVAVGGWAGVVAPVLFVAVVLIAGWARAGYDPVGQYLSELSLGRSGWVQIANFVVTGALMLVFAFGVSSALPGGVASVAGAVLLAIIGVCLLLSGPFVIDPPAAAPDQETLAGRVHDTLGPIIFLLTPITCAVYAAVFADDAGWRWFAAWTVLAAVVTAAGFVLLVMAVRQRAAGGGALDRALGLIQRAAIFAFFAWVFVFAIGLVWTAPDLAAGGA